MLFPEYYVLRVNDFDSVAKTPLDEWIAFLKTGQISKDAKAAGLPEARERLRVDALSEDDRQAYFRHMESVRHMKSLFDTSRDEGYEEGRAEGREEGRAEGRKEGREEGRAEGREEGKLLQKIEMARTMLADGMQLSLVMKYTGLTKKQIEESRS